jgi:hypothetical protein
MFQSESAPSFAGVTALVEAFGAVGIPLKVVKNPALAEDDIHLFFDALPAS